MKKEKSTKIKQGVFMDFTTIRGLLFDFDGVIANTAKDIAQSVNATLENFGFDPLSQEQIIIFVGNGAERLLRRSIAASIQLSKKNPEDINAPAFEEIYAWYVDYYRKHAIEQTELYPGTIDLLELLSILGIPAAIVSNKPHEITDAILQQMDISKYFAAIIGPEQTNHVKPDPEGLILAMEQINQRQQAARKPLIPPENFLMVGDTHTDIEAGKNAGTKTCALTSGFGNKDKLLASLPDVTLHMVCELIVHIQHSTNF